MESKNIQTEHLSEQDLQVRHAASSGRASPSGVQHLQKETEVPDDLSLETSAAMVGRFSSKRCEAISLDRVVETFSIQAFASFADLENKDGVDLFFAGT